MQKQTIIPNIKSLEELDSYLEQTANDNFLSFLRSLSQPRKSVPLGKTSALFYLNAGCYHASVDPTYKALYVPEDGKTNIFVGDIHGDYENLAPILETFFANENIRLICLGDYIDRGRYSLKTMKALLVLQEKYPDRVILLTGNHEFDLGDRLNTKPENENKVGMGLYKDLQKIDTPINEFGDIGNEISKRLLLIAYGKDFIATHSSLYGGDPLSFPYATTFVDKSRWIVEGCCETKEEITIAVSRRWPEKKIIVRGHTFEDLAKQEGESEEGVYRCNGITVYTLHTTGGKSNNAFSFFRVCNHNPKVLVCAPDQPPRQMLIARLQDIDFKSYVKKTSCSATTSSHTATDQYSQEERAMINGLFGSSFAT